MMQPDASALIDAACRPYRAASRHAYHFVRGKLRHDPVFFSLLRSGRIPDRARLLDLGCGHAVLAALLLAARERFDAGLWPAGWDAPPSGLQLHGVEAEAGAAQRARMALGSRVIILTGDLRDTALPEADIIVMIDVLHYLEATAQVSLLERAAQSLRGDGLLVLRVADVTAGWRFHLGKAADRFGSLLSARGLPKHYYRPLDEWLRLLRGLGFDPRVEPDRSFANVLVWAKAAPRSAA